MFSFITGIIEEKENNIAILNCNGVGFELNVSETTIFELPNKGELATIYTYMAVREDAITLFGFATKEEKDVFLKLISVSGIGGKMAIAILSAMPVADLIVAIASENIKLLSSVKGLGKKTAERLVLELKSSFDDMQLSMLVTNKGVSAPNSAIEETIDTLVAMGLTRAEATQIVKNVASQDDTAETLIKKSLKNLNR
ncbi:MAG: Holliday junction branch migration protein RuvA [Clostridiales bacterium]|nr:Holliday junction branch migration protein RuvA [Clostridiales bacterium]